MKKEYSLVLDVGTSGIKAFVFDGSFRIIKKAYVPIDTVTKEDGVVVEQDPETIFRLSKEVMKEVFFSAGISESLYKGCGITNQRETVIAWNKNSGIPTYPAIVWQDTRTREVCNILSHKHGSFVREHTGLSLDPYFSAPKIDWLFRNSFVSQSDIVGTVDSWLIWNMTENRLHLTDTTNASRTLLLDIRTRMWKKELLSAWNIGRHILPEVFGSRSDFGVLNRDIFGFSMPIMAVCGDQQSSWYAANSLHDASTKITFGTGIFMMQRISSMKLYDDFFTTVIPDSGDSKGTYAIEQKIASVCAEKVTPYLGNLPVLRPIMESFAHIAADAVNHLPERPTRIVVDGGVTQSDDLIHFLRMHIKDVSIIRQEPYDGTALGVAALIQKKR